MLKCTICGDEIKPTDREAMHFEIFSVNTDCQNSGNICGECVQLESNGFFKLWRKNKHEME